MFGEDASESPRQPSPWGGSHTQTPCRIPTPSSSLSLSHSQPLSHNSLTSSSSSLLEEVDAFSGEVSSSGSDEDEARDELGATSFSSSAAASRTALALGRKPPRRLSAEDDDQGHIEYKLKLTAATPDRFNRLVTQLKWRLLQGGGEAMYEIGVLDDGTLVGLSRVDLLASLRTLERMADELGATVVVLKEIRLDHAEATGDANDEGGKRRKWEKWKAFVDSSKTNYTASSEHATVPADPSTTGTTSSATPGSSATPVLMSPTTNAHVSPIADLPSVVSGTTPELFFVSKAQDKSSRKKKKRNTSILDDPEAPSPLPPPHLRSDYPIPKPKIRRHKQTQPKIVSDDDEGGMFSVFDLDLNAPDSASPQSKPQPPATQTKKSKKKLHEEEKAARRKLKRALKDEESMRSLWGGGEDVEIAAGADDDGWAGQSLDPWSSAVDDLALAADSLALDPDAPLLATSPTKTIIPQTPPGGLIDIESGPQQQPSPLLLPTYRPPTALMQDRADEQVDDGSERICVEALVVRKEMEGYLNFEDVGKWMSGKGVGAFA